MCCLLVKGRTLSCPQVSEESSFQLASIFVYGAVHSPDVFKASLVRDTDRTINDQAAAFAHHVDQAPAIRPDIVRRTGVEQRRRNVAPQSTTSRSLAKNVKNTWRAHDPKGAVRWHHRGASAAVRRALQHRFVLSRSPCCSACLPGQSCGHSPFLARTRTSARTESAEDLLKCC